MKNKHNELISSLSDKELLVHLYMTQFILMVISVILGFILFDHFAYLKNIQIFDLRIITIGVPAGCTVVILDMTLMKILPPSYYDDGGLNERIFRKRTIFHIFIIAILVAFSEELLFRGIIQEKVGLITASIIFAIVHYRYLFNWFLFINIVLLSFMIGVIYMWTDNLAVTIIMHFVIDLLLGIYLKFRRPPEGRVG
ncbi:CPBP family intramembrane metalloprotease [Bacillus sp. BRMEA1]|uniref:CPBP family intramembrane glutamic endopeptidase n=1 Tax=Neobacillus endophyticus TaxID=2738405 RepID=UPI001565AE78|nr:type II CAAX endopeptidase family protein [Neobacillus endophyticus]NRD80605.1 CPBP family intramembrane metalloprotease [Neobacillus endophyticus]